MTDHWISELIGVAAGTCTTISLVPQLRRIWRAKSARDISMTMFAIFGLGVLFWLVYGIRVRSVAVIAANSATLLLTLMILGLSVRYQRER